MNASKNGAFVQTFLPFPDYSLSAKVLDRQRLGKQRVETFQILKALTLPKYGWQNHPAVLMWRGFEIELVEYGIAICNEWVGRGYKDSITSKLEQIKPKLIEQELEIEHAIPPWLGDERLHSSHRAALLSKNYGWYSQFDWSEKPAYDYYWPVTRPSAKKARSQNPFANA
jgi:hypothetical protein